MIRAIAFDLDNTLIDFMTFKRETAKAAAKAMVKAGLKAKPLTVARQIFEIYDEYGIEYQKTLSTLLWKIYRIRDFNRFERIQQAGIVAYMKRKLNVLKPYKDVAPTLKKLKKRGFLLCIVTDAPRNKAWQRLTITGLQNLFDHVITYDDTNARKPDQLPFNAMIRKAKVKPGEVLFVGDSPKRDIEGAKRVGMKTALALYGGELNKKSKVHADIRLRRFGELLECV